MNRMIKLLVLAISFMASGHIVNAQSIDNKVTVEDFEKILQKSEIINGNDYLRHYKADETNPKKAKYISEEILIDYLKNNSNLKVSNIQTISINQKKGAPQVGIREFYFFWKEDQDRIYEETKAVLAKEHPGFELVYLYINEKDGKASVDAKDKVNYVVYKYVGDDMDDYTKQTNLILLYNLPTFEEEVDSGIFFKNNRGRQRYIGASYTFENDPNLNYTYPAQMAVFELTNTEKSLYREQYADELGLDFGLPLTFAVNKDTDKEFKIIGPKSLGDLQKRLYAKARERSSDIAVEILNKEAYYELFGDYMYESILSEIEAYKELQKTREDILNRSSSKTISIKRL